MQKTTLNTSAHAIKTDEHILVIKRTDLFANDTAWHGLKKVDFSRYMTLIQEKKEFLPRSLMEVDPSYKQIIPYLIFHHDGRYFLMQRQAKASETRLQNKYTLGIGGHIRQEDMEDGVSIFDWARREFHEEVSYQGDFAIETLGILNDDTNEVGRVHIGFVFLLHGDSGAIRVKSELKSGEFKTAQECRDLGDRMETWSQMVLTGLE